MQKKYLISNLCLDLDGTVYRDGKLFPGVKQKLNELHNNGVNIFYITNNTSKSFKEYGASLRAIGLPFCYQNLVTPISVFNDSSAADRKTYVLGQPEVVKEVKNSVKHLNEADQILVTFDKTLTYEKLALVCGAINAGMPYYGTHYDLNCPSDSGPIPDCGAILRLLEATTSKSPIMHFGKPSKSYASFTAKLLCKQSTLVVGDRHSTDWEVGKLLGATSVLVETGEHIPQHIYDKAIVHETLVSVLENYFG